MQENFSLNLIKIFIMKRILQTAAIFCVVAAFSVGFAQGQAKITFEDTQHNFGSFMEAAGVQTTTFTFKNTGTSPLILNSVRASCGCTTPKWTRDPIAPNGSGEITVSIIPKIVREHLIKLLLWVQMQRMLQLF